MDLIVEELERNRKKLKITIPKEVVSRKVDGAYKELNRQIRMPGFRPGKIPQAILEKQVPVQSFTKMFQELMQEYYDEALRETGITPAGQPEIDNSEIQDVRKDAPFSFSVVLDIKPEIGIDLKQYKGLKLKRLETGVSEAEVENTLQHILTHYGHFEHYEDGHEAQLNDHLVLDFDGYLDDEPLEGGSARKIEVRIGEKKLIEGFEDQLVGHKEGEEFEVKVFLPPNWNQKVRRVSLPIPGADPEKHQDLARFQVKIREIKKLVKPELSDEIAQKEGFDSVEALRRGIKTNLQAQKEQKEELRIKEEIFNKLVQEHEVHPPDSLVKRELKYMIEGMKYQIEQSGMKLEDSGFDEKKAEQEWRERAEFNTKGYLVLEAIASRENLHVTQQDLDAEYRQLAKQTQKDLDQVKASMMNNPESMGQTTSKLLGQKTMNFLFSHCEFEFVKELPRQEEAPSGQEEAPSESGR